MRSTLRPPGRPGRSPLGQDQGPDGLPRRHGRHRASAGPRQGWCRVGSAELGDGSERGLARALDPRVCRLFIIDGAKALTKAIRKAFGRHTPIQRCQIHKARNIVERLPKSLHASTRRALRQAWELDDADKAEKLIRNLARRLERDAPGRGSGGRFRGVHQQTIIVWGGDVRRLWNWTPLPDAHGKARPGKQLSLRSPGQIGTSMEL